MPLLILLFLQGFADDWHTTCRKDVMATAHAMPLSMCTSFAQGGYTELHEELETNVADFVGKEAAVRRYSLRHATAAN